MPAGYVTLVRGPIQSGVTQFRGTFEPTLVMVERLTRVYEEFVRTPIPDRIARREQSLSWRRLGFLYVELDRPVEGRRAYDKAVQLAQELCELDAKSRASRIDLALARAYRGLHLLARREQSNDLSKALHELTALGEEDSADPLPPSEQGELILRRSLQGLTASAQLSLLNQSLMWQKIAYTRRASPLVADRLKRTFEAIMLRRLSTPDWPAAKLVFEDWVGTFPPSAAHHLSMADVATYCCWRTRDAELARPWLTKIREHLEAYRSLGGTRTDTTAAIARTKPIDQNEPIQAVISSLPRPPIVGVSK